MLTHALKYFREGFDIIPLTPASKKPFPGREWGETQFTKEEEVTEFWMEFPDANIGIRTEGLCVIDVDFLKEGKDYYSEENFAKCMKGLTSKYRVRTRGGFHAYYEKPDFPIGVSENGDTTDFEGIDIMTGKRYIVAPPSAVVENGTVHTYSWMTLEGERAKLTPLPTSAVAFINKFKRGNGVRKKRAGKKAVEVDRPGIADLLIKYDKTIDTRSTHSSCPFPDHEDNNPSFRISREDHLFHCSCAPSNTGDYIMFICRMEGWTERGDYPGKEARIKAFDKLRSWNIEYPPADDLQGQVDDQVREFNKTHFLFAQGNTTMYEVNSNGLTSFTASGFRTTFGNEKIGKTTFADHWLKSPHRRDVNKFVMKPVGKEGSREFNLFSGWTSEPVETDVSMFINHIGEVLCNGDQGLADWFLDWLAHIFQKPFEKPEVAVVLYSENQGTGKSSLVRALSKIMGRHFFVTSDHSFLSGRFNTHLIDKILVTGEEATWGGQKTVGGQLKSFVTERTFTTEEKFGAKIIIPSYHRLLVPTNELWSVPMGTNDRRWTCIETGEVREKAYFNKLYKLMNRPDFSSGLLHWFLQRKITHSMHQAYDTDLKSSVIQENMKPFQSWWLECLDTGFIGTVETKITVEQWEAGDIKVPTKHLLDSWLNWRRDRSRNQHEKPVEMVGLRHYIRKYLFNDKLITGDHKYIDGKRLRCVDIPALDQCKKLFASSIGVREWDVLVHDEADKIIDGEKVVPFRKMVSGSKS